MRARAVVFVVVVGLGLAALLDGCNLFVGLARCQSDEQCPTAAPFCNAATGACQAEPCDDCESDDAGEPGRDAGPPRPDAGPGDGGVTVVDAGPIDSGPVDSGAVDSGPVDSGPVDSGPVDSGTVDSGTVDAGWLDGGQPDAGPCGNGSPCVFDAECTTPCGDMRCHIAQCGDEGCEYTPLDDDTVCERGCGEGELLTSTCQAGDCVAEPGASCSGFACDDGADGGPACKTSCAGASDCVDGHFCNDLTSACEPRLDDGASCAGLPEGACLSGYCDGELCCASGDCCNSVADCPAEYSTQSTCSDPSETTTCQGTAVVAECSGNVCSSLTIDDDRGCAGALHACPDNLAPIACSALAVQSTPDCPTECASTADCRSGFTCNAPNCEVIAGLGDPCGFCNAGLQCDHDVCCSESAAACCTPGTQSIDCVNGLTCDGATFSCRTSCVAGTDDGCADPVNEYCVDGVSCDVKRTQGQLCDVADQCISGECVDGVCCEGACDGTCESCRAAKTGLPEGTCGVVTSGIDGACNLGGGCGAAPCRCSTDGACKRDLSAVCTLDFQCASGNCECTNADCTERRCNAVDCGTCLFADTNYADATCDGYASGACAGCSGTDCRCGNGKCLNGYNSVCSADSDCQTNNCACADYECASKKCTIAPCKRCEFDSDGITPECNGLVKAGKQGDCPSGTYCVGGGQPDTCAPPPACTCECYEVNNNVCEDETYCPAPFVLGLASCSIGSCGSGCVASGACTCVPPP